MRPIPIRTTSPDARIASTRAGTDGNDQADWFEAEREAREDTQLRLAGEGGAGPELPGEQAGRRRTIGGARVNVEFLSRVRLVLPQSALPPEGGSHAS
jgi:hypothetical protein